MLRMTAKNKQRQQQRQEQQQQQQQQQQQIPFGDDNQKGKSYSADAPLGMDLIAATA